MQYLLRTAQEPSEQEAKEIEIEMGEYKQEVLRHAMQKAKLEQALAKRQGSLLGSK